MLNNIEIERVRIRLSKEELSEKLGVTTRTYYNWINEKTDIPSSALLKMSYVFNVDVGYLLSGAKDELQTKSC